MSTPRYAHPIRRQYDSKTDSYVPLLRDEIGDVIRHHVDHADRGGALEAVSARLDALMDVVVAITNTLPQEAQDNIADALGFEVRK